MYEPLLFIRWGSGPDEATPRYVDIVAGGLQARPPARRRVEPLRLRLDAAGGYHLHSPGDGAILAFDAGRRFLGKVKLPVPGTLRDLAADPATYFAIVEDGARAALLAFDRTGAVAWRRDDLDPGIDRVVRTRAGLFVAASPLPGALIEIDPATGEPLRPHEMLREAIDPVAAPDGAIVAAAYLPEQRRRGVLVYEPATGQASVAAAGPDLYGTLLGVVGATAGHELIVHGAVRGDPRASLFTLGPDARVRRRIGLDALLAPRPGEAIAGRFGDAALILEGTGVGLPATIPLPEGLRSVPIDRLTLIEASPARVVLDVRSADGLTTERRALEAATGRLVPVATGDRPALVPGMQPRATWQVTADGRVLVPVVSEAGLAVVAILP